MDASEPDEISPRGGRSLPARTKNDLESQTQIVRGHIQGGADFLQFITHRDHPVAGVAPFRKVRGQARAIIPYVDHDLAASSHAAFDRDFGRNAGGVGVAIGIDYRIAATSSSMSSGSRSVAGGRDVTGQHQNACG